MVKLSEFVLSNGGGLLYVLVALHRLNEFARMRFGVAAAAAAAATCGEAAICSRRATLLAV